ncbi:MAG: hypothetical protein ACRC57_12265 [Sarcina sp.]
MKLKKGKAAILTIAAAAFIASIVYDKTTNKKEKAKEFDEETETSFIVE